MSDLEHECPPLDPRLAAAAAQGCEESRLLLNRRAMLGLSAGLFSWAYMPRHAEAAGTEPRLLVVLLRGGLDGLNAAVPLEDYANYESLRGDLALDPATLLGLDGKYGLNPAMPKFKARYDAGQAAIIHAIAPPLRTRSHFDCQYNLESGLPGGNVRSSTTGWLNRLLMLLPSGDPIKLRGGLQIGAPPLILAGDAPIMSWSPGGWPRPGSINARIQSLYRKTDNRLSELLDRGLETHSLATTAQEASFPPGTPTAWQQAFRGAGSLLAAETGPRIAVLNVDGWDTHITQRQEMTTRLSAFDTALDDFRIAVGAGWSSTVVVCITEMGRTAFTNGRSGTDHGIGTVAFLAGGAVQGGQVIVDWPGLANNQLVDKRDLRATSDLRAVFKGILADHLQVPRSLLERDIFPASAEIAPMAGLIRSTSAGAIAPMASRSTRQQTAAVPFSAIARFRQQKGVVR